MEKLPNESLRLIFRNLCPEDAGKAACVQKSWRELLCEDDLWQDHCKQRWKVGSKQGPDDTMPKPDFRSTFATWQHAFGQYGPVAPQLRQIWCSLEQWTSSNTPEVFASLRKGATEDEIDAAEKAMAMKLPAAVRCLYRMHDGQDLAITSFEMKRLPPSELEQEAVPSLLHGLFGGYAFYEYLACARFLSLQQSVVLKATLQAQFARALGVETAASMFQHLFLIASAFQPAVQRTKVFFVVLHGGEEHEIATLDQTAFLRTVLQKQGHASASGRPEAPALPLIPAVPASAEPGHCSIVRWFQALSDQLESGMLGADQILKQKGLPVTGISLYPAAPPLQSTAVSRGVEIKASALFVPEQSKCSQSAYHFAYSVRFRLLSVEDQERMGTSQPLESAQLLLRHWRIQDASRSDVERVDGEGVIGQFPILLAGGEEYVYQSCMTCGRMGGWMEGSFTFIEGSLQMPLGPQFEAQCARFPMERPGVIF